MQYDKPVRLKAEKTSGTFSSSKARPTAYEKFAILRPCPRGRRTETTVSRWRVPDQPIDALILAERLALMNPKIPAERAALKRCAQAAARECGLPLAIVDQLFEFHAGNITYGECAP